MSPFQKQRFGLNARKLKKISNQTFHKSPFFTWLMSNTLWRNVGLFLSSTVQILDSLFLFVYSTALNNFLHNYDFVMIIMRDFSARKESHKRLFHVDIPKVPI